MSWAVTISPGAVNDPGAFTINAAMKFDLSGRVHDDENGRVQYIEYFVELEGDIVATPASAVAINTLAMMDQLKSYIPRNVYLVLDGVTRYTWTVATCIGSPRVMAFHTRDEDGNADSHWRYALTIYAKQQGNLPGGALELQTSLLVVTEQNQIVRKVWRASCKASTTAGALAIVLSFAPSDKTLKTEIERAFQENKASAVWVWELYKNLTITEEPIEWIGNGQNYVWDPQCGQGQGNVLPPPPIIHQATREITKAIVKGIVRGTDPNKLSPPPPHWSDDRQTSFRMFSEERTYSPGLGRNLEDALRGIYELPYMEVWLFPDSVPAPNHNGHLTPQFVQIPGDGSMAT